MPRPSLQLTCHDSHGATFPSVLINWGLNPFQSNRDRFGKSKCGREESAFPMLRIVTLISASTRLILDFTYGSSQGKGTESKLHAVMK